MEPVGYGRLIDFLLDIDMELNDKRPKYAQPMVWYLKVGVRWVAGSSPLQPVSCLNILNVPSRPFDARHQMSTQGFYLTASHVQRVFWYASIIQTEGKMLYMRPHNHLPSLYKGFLFRGGVRETGLQDFDKTLDSPYLPNAFDLNGSRFSDFASVEKHLLQHARHLLVCAIEPRFLVKAGRAFGHGYKTLDCSGWSFKASDWFTSVTLVDQVHDNTILPEFVPLHTHWIMLYVHSQQASRYDVLYVGNTHRSAFLGTKVAKTGSLDSNLQTEAGQDSPNDVFFLVWSAAFVGFAFIQRRYPTSAML